MTPPPNSIPAKGSAAKSSLDSVDRTARVLNALGSEGPHSLAAVARATDLSEATALRYLTSLAVCGFVERTGDGLYRLGWEMFRLGQLAAANRVPRDVVRPILDRLLDQFSETVNLAVYEDDKVLVVDVLDGTRGLRKVTNVGQRDPWHASALGKALLSRMPETERERLLRRSDLQAYTANTIVDIKRLQAELDRTAQRGFAIDAEEAEQDLTCVAASVLSRRGDPWLAISVSFLAHRLSAEDLEVAGAAVRDAAAEMQALLGMPS